ncbi:RHS repeat-associated core domain-containing protein [Candidatus Amarolinea aalborgensis]|uniref:RHS repeat-associated core domain-containing protein n=1 Tax=Candidatus Amarolinea aalborgensis TaxID=2249329 RepID=UPI003BF98330
MTANETGARIAELRYKLLRQAQGKSWGESRYSFGATPTARLRLRRAQSSRSPKSQRRFTGQTLDNIAGGLYFYNARYYDPALGRFASADTIVPQPGNPQSLNRYSYALNNSVRLTDPTGMFSEEEIEAYLRTQYGDHWQSYWDAWHSDQVFWQMLELADYDDVLFAPTTSLTSGTFVHVGNTFGFSGQHALYEYQGYGPYRLTNANGTVDKQTVQSHITAHPVDTDPTRYQTWEQPLYRYTKDGPKYSGYNRRVSYQKGKTGVSDWLAGDSLPYIVGGGITEYLLAQVGLFVACPVCAAVIPVAAFAAAANSSVSTQYALIVNMTDQRTFLQAVNMCFPTPSDESGDLWK